MGKTMDMLAEEAFYAGKLSGGMEMYCIFGQ